ncbi:TIGR02300 family protein [Rhodoligotrophos appendicifer]|nr:TIGR02300 family protein [Rhodoligotrophos appendicifer]
MLANGPRRTIWGAPRHLPPFAFDSRRGAWHGDAQIQIYARVRSVVKPELGTKRTCPNCSTRFYDLEKDPIHCPKCSYSFVAESLLPSKMDQMVPVAPAPKVEPKVVDDEEEFEDVELVSLEDIEEDVKDDDEEDVPAIEDVEIGDDDVKPDDDTFLEDDDEEGSDVTGIIGVNDDDEET